jgi:hypothetical protein
MGGKSHHEKYVSILPVWPLNLWQDLKFLACSIKYMERCAMEQLRTTLRTNAELLSLFTFNKNITPKSIPRKSLVKW